MSSLADIYIAAVSASHNVAAKDVWIAEVSTIVETSVPEREILPGLQLLGTVVDKYVPLFSPLFSTFSSRLFSPSLTFPPLYSPL